MSASSRLKIALFANPESGSGEAREVARLLRARGADVVELSLDGPPEAVDQDVDRVAVAGGDGSVASVAVRAGAAGLPLAVIPVGTANDFARALELPLQVEPACALALEGQLTRALDLGWMDERPFVNAASVGLSPVAAQRAQGLKRVLGPVAYAVGALRAAASAKPVQCRILGDGKLVHAGPAWQATVACTGAFGAGAEVDADPRDGALDVVVIEAGSRWRLVQRASGLRAGTVESQTGVRNARAREVEVQAEGGSGFNVDGELVDTVRARFRVSPHAFGVVVG
ncbi:MAG TPA: diacylglycerol kinase family protein [Solirubrobacterales bacterium]|nr:diacylglycerol kinase family protein [Solirubrobacterales bacterium]